MRTTSRSCRIAVVTVGAVVALAASAVSSFAHTQSTAGSSSRGDIAVRDTSFGGRSGDDQGVFPGVATSPAVGGWESKGVIHLGGGWTAGIDVNVSARSARADIALNGVIKRNLDAYAKSASVKIDDRTFTLTPSGTVTSKIDTAPAPMPGAWQSKGVTRLGNGWTAKVSVNASARTARAAIALDGIVKARFEAYTKSTGIKIGHRTFTLTPTGTVTSRAAG